MDEFAPIPHGTNAIAKDVIDAAIKIHSSLGPCLLENVYKACLAQELGARGHSVRMEVALPINYE